MRLEVSGMAVAEEEFIESAARRSGGMVILDPDSSVDCEEDGLVDGQRKMSRGTAMSQATRCYWSCSRIVQSKRVLLRV